MQAKGGWLYIFVPLKKIEKGQRASSKRWVATKMTDTASNVKKAAEMRKSLLAPNSKVLTNDHNILFPAYVDLYLARKKRTVADTTYAGYFYRGIKIKEFFEELLVLYVHRKYYLSRQYRQFRIILLYERCDHLSTESLLFFFRRPCSMNVYSALNTYPSGGMSSSLGL